MNHDPLNSLDARLSPAGETRKQAMLANLQREVTGRGRRRRVARAVIVAVPVLALAIVGVLVLRWATLPASIPTPGPITDLPTNSETVDHRGIAATSDDAIHDPHGGTTPDALAHAATRFTTIDSGWDLIPRVRPTSGTRIRTASGDPGLLDRSRYRGGGASVPLATDAQLAVALRAAGRAAGVARTPTGVQIIPDHPTQPG